MPSILFLCTYNSVRSQIAEGVCRQLHPDWNINSAGVARGNISPYVVRCLEESGCDCSNMQAKHLTELPDQTYDVIIVLCENAWGARDHFPKTKKLLFHPIRSPEPWIGEDELSDYRRTRDELRQWMLDELSAVL
ncbi:hypothetical protein [Methanorbis rubei]|uniref:Arsenate reductase n=1 Tax=Methanorbis rubei TaxID=3028300 RepID=A0AAE4MGH6_9EURY|nr:Arsenate reductase [Methanocorpusculaceae archaeon Cs1]